MTFEEMELAMKEVKDNLLVQSHLLDRVDRSIEVSRRDFDERINALLGIAENHEGRLQTMQAALQSLIANIDRFIQGAGPDGHGRKGEE